MLRRLLASASVAVAACVVVDSAAVVSSAEAAPTAVGSGANQAYLAFNFPDGFVKEYQVSFDGTIDGYALTAIADQADPALGLSWGNFGDTTPSYYLSAAVYFGGHSGNDTPWNPSTPANWWHEWVDKAGESAGWGWGNGASFDTFTDGDRLAWVFGTDAQPVGTAVPEPGAVGALLLGATGLLGRRRRAA